MAEKEQRAELSPKERAMLPDHGPLLGAQRAELSPKERAVIREHGLNFVLSMLEGRGEEVEEVQKAVAVLVQHMAAKVPDKADWRREAAAAIIRLLEALPANLLQAAIRWLLRFAHSEKPSNRLFCLEVLGKLVHSEAVVPARATAEAATAEAPVVPPAAMFACVFGRCSDVSPSVRSAALKTLAEMTEGGGAAAALLAEVLASDAQGEEVVLATVLQDEEADLATVRLLPSRHRFISFIRRRALDLSVAVRRSALQVLENLLRSSEG